ncbi:MAG: amino acid adenylation domain-containing protein, partial [Burkholderiaceae bacterium]|nr:amino acid adenylation domain-containing protein [Burkholderiaceae bacterium]
TSGSTGRPKGVMVPHRGVCNHVFWLTERISLTAADRVLQKTSVSFDASVPEFFAPLSVGGAVILAGIEGEKDTGALVEAIRREGVTVFQSVPSALRVLLQEPSIGSCDSLRYVVSGGEALDRELAHEFRRRLPGARLGNFYGPTEASIDAASVDVAEVITGDAATEVATDDAGATDATETEALEAVPIGRPVANARVYVLDAWRRPVPIGVPGELYIGGAGLARGYLNRPELTHERFVDDPFTPGERLYRTGDLVRWRPDGLLGFIGRTDHQVKIRGFRIEPGEIEAVLRTCPGVRQATVVVAQESEAVARLVGYVVPETLDVEALRESVKSQLPDYMVPSVIMAIAAMPTLPNGKLDRKALPAPDWSARQSLQQEPPQGPTEQALAEIWSRVLGISDIGRHDNFFELGGHSLLVVTMVQAALRRNLPISVRAVFTHPTVATLAASMPAPSNEPAPTSAPAIPDNPIPRDCTALTPAMLPLVELSQPDIDRIVATVAGGAANIQDIYPLAPLQEGILYHHQLDTEGDTYLIRRILPFDSRARLDAFLQALQVVIDRHDSLRTAVVWEGLPQPVQVVYRQACLPVQWLGCNAGEDPLEVLEAQSDPTRLRFALTQAPLMRAYAAQEHDGQACCLALVDHHIIADHASADLIIEEIQALLDGRAETLEEPVQFRSFVAQVRATTPARHEAYFRRLLGDVTEPTLPFGLADTRVDQSRIRESRDSLSGALAERIRSAANRRGVSAAVLFHVTWGMVLARCSGQEDVVFGTVLLGRSGELPGIDRVIGLCMNTLPVRLRLASASAEAVVADTYRQLGELIEHEQTPLALAQRCSAVPASVPLFSALLNYRHDLPASTVLDEERTNYPVCVSVDDIGTGFHVTAQCVDGIDPQRLVDYLAVAIGALVDALDRDPQAPVCSLDLLPGRERELLTGTWNETAREYPRERTVVQLFEAQAARRPDAVAVTYAGESLSYRELNARASALARRLRALGVRPGVPVGLCVERSLPMMVGLLATLKAGGAYVPLDPAFPAQRLAFMLQDSQASVLLTQTSLAGLLAADTVQVVNLDRLAPGDLLDGEDLPSAAGPDDLAYVLYTSGSTGKPKGVEITHRALTNFLWSMRTAPGCDEHDVLLAVTTLSFDIAGLELYLPLITGARVELVSRETATDGQLLRERVEQVDPTLLQATPATWRMLIDAGWTGNRRLTALIGGEPLPPELVQPLLERTKALWNLYGPTETTIWSSVKQVTGASGPITVGRPIANTTFYIVDKALQPVPLGVAGELLIGGDGLARGYRGRPELTAEKFIAHPFSDEPGARLYRTGDLARYQADGEVVHLGRLDHQVKIRGFRIELGEIEAALTRCAEIAQSVVMAREDAAGSAALVAYVVPAAGQSASATQLRQALRETLPDYMVPQHFVVLSALPLLPNGKLDRKALPA